MKSKEEAIKRYEKNLATSRKYYHEHREEILEKYHQGKVRRILGGEAVNGTH